MVKLGLKANPLALGWLLKIPDVKVRDNEGWK